VEVRAGECVIVPKGTRHRPIVRERSRFLLMEHDGTLNESNTGGGVQT
jgi:mannose-6-phosphate isomerase-like protein (cupin superfamily)